MKNAPPKVHVLQGDDSVGRRLFLCGRSSKMSPALTRKKAGGEPSRVTCRDCARIIGELPAADYSSTIVKDARA